MKEMTAEGGTGINFQPQTGFPVRLFLGALPGCDRDRLSIAATLFGKWTDPQNSERRDRVASCNKFSSDMVAVSVNGVGSNLPFTLLR